MAMNDEVEFSMNIHVEKQASGYNWSLHLRSRTEAGIEDVVTKTNTSAATPQAAYDAALAWAATYVTLE